MARAGRQPRERHSATSATRSSFFSTRSTTYVLEDRLEEVEPVHITHFVEEEPSALEYNLRTTQVVIAATGMHRVAGACTGRRCPTRRCWKAT